MELRGIEKEKVMHCLQLKKETHLSLLLECSRSLYSCQYGWVRNQTTLDRVELWSVSIKYPMILFVGAHTVVGKGVIIKLLPNGTKR